MDARLVALLGRSMFGVLVALLRPTVRGRDGAVAIDSSGRRLLPLQSGVLTVHCAGGIATVVIEQSLTNPHNESLGVACTMALPCSAIVSDLSLGALNTPVVGQIRERRAARALFELRRRGGSQAALLCEDAPGIVSHEIAGLPPHHSVRTTIRFAYQLHPEALLHDRFRMLVHFDAAANAVATAPPRRKMLRLGHGRVLDSLFGVEERPPTTKQTWIPRVLRGGRDRIDTHSPAIAGSTPVSAMRAELTRVLPASEHDVLVSCDSSDGSGAAWRGELAGRRVRVVASTQTSAAAPPASLWSHAAQEVAHLMRRYVEGDLAEAKRNQLMSHISEIGLRHRLVTMWTSLVAASAGLRPDTQECPEGA